MRKLLLLLIIASSLWGGYWFVGKSAVETGLRSWIDQRRSDGWAADYTELKTRGFPNRFDTSITDLSLADPATGLAWELPVFQILALSYKPNHIIAVFAQDQVLATPNQRITISNETMRGSVVFEPGTDLTLQRSSFILEDLKFSSSKGWSSSLGSGSFATRQSVAIPLAHDIAFSAQGLSPSTTLRDRLDPTGALPESLETLSLDLTAGFTAPWDRFAIERARPQLTSLDVKNINARWGDLDLRMAGELQVGTDGVPEGKITIRAENWRDMIALAKNSGSLSDGLASGLERALALVAGMSGDKDVLEADLTFSRGRMSLGILPLGPAPKLILR